MFNNLGFSLLNPVYRDRFAQFYCLWKWNYLSTLCRYYVFAVGMCFTVLSLGYIHHKLHCGNYNTATQNIYKKNFIKVYYIVFWKFKCLRFTVYSSTKQYKNESCNNHVYYFLFQCNLLARKIYKLQDILRKLNDYLKQQ